MEEQVKDINELLKEELVQSPGRTALRNFFDKKLSYVGIAIFLFIFIFCIAGSLILPIDLAYTDSTRMNLRPAFNYLALPKALENNAKEIAFGSTFGAGIDNGGQLYMWGTMTDRIKNEVPENMGRLKLVSAGLDHVVAVNESNQVFAWGNNRLNITRIADSVRGKNIVDIQAGYQVTAALDDQGFIHFWGNENNYSFYPGDNQGNIRQFAMNITTIVVLTKDNGVAALARGDTAFNRVPANVQGNAIAVASTDYVAAAVLRDNTVVTWGLDNAAAYTVPAEIQGRVKSLEGGRQHFTAILTDGSLYSWGNNTFGEGDYPKAKSGAASYVRITTNYYQNAAIDANGKVTTWGQKGYLMGTDQWGRDVFTRLIYGGRISLTVGFISVIIAGAIGILLGGFSGYFGGKVDMFIMRFGEVINSIPFIPLALILSAIMANKVPETARVLMIMVILGFLNWPFLARLTRGQILSEKENEFVVAAKAMGVKELLIVFKHILPNVLPIVLVNLTLSMATCILLESSLSFLGFGIIEPTPTWGNMLNKCVDSIVIRNYWWRWVFPAVALGLSVISINIIGDGLRDAIDPKSNDR